MKALNKSEWFEFESPIGEPDIKWSAPQYCIERITKTTGEVIWFGQEVNWKRIDDVWSVLGEDETVKPTLTYYDKETGKVSGYDYPEGRQIWIECEMPIYEKMYLEFYS